MSRCLCKRQQLVIQFVIEMSRACFSLVLTVCLLAQAWGVPADRLSYYRRVRAPQNEKDNTIDTTTTTASSIDPLDDDDDDFDADESMDTAPSTGGGSNILSLLNLATALFPSSSSSNRFIRNMIRQILRNPESLTQLLGVVGGFPPIAAFPPLLRREDIKDNIIEVDYVKKLTPPFQRQEDDDDDHDDSSHDDDSDSDSEENYAAEESIETSNGNSDNGNDKASKQDSGDGGDDNDSDYSDEPPEGDGQGGGILGLLAGLSGGEDGQSDLGTLLGAVSGIVANLSGGEGFDLNALIASGLGLFVGLLSEGEENPGAVIASYLLTSLDTITGGGANNNGAFFGTLLSKLVKGTSAAGGDSASSEENGNGMKMTDSTGFFVSLLMGLLGDMSKGSSGGSSH